jgi:AAA+ ATPase superfamily predicted ATPase
MLDPLRNIGKELVNLIDTKQYFVIHAARQSGKTTLLWELTDKINAEGKYHALYCSLEGVQGIAEPEKGIPEITRNIESSVKNQGLPKGFAKDANYSSTSTVLNDAFVDYCRSLDKPLIVFFDEADCLSNGTLIMFLRQLRNGFVSRARVPFVHSIALVGMRNIRDYKAHIRPDSETLGSASPFNIMKESLNLKNFSKECVIELYNQHTEETGQIFEPQAMDYIYEQTWGQPWLVNAIACQCVEKICEKKYSIPITQKMAETAINELIIKRPTHIDSLMERLKEERIRKIICPLISGNDMTVDKNSDDYLYTRDLGLIKEVNGMAVPSNQIYAEAIIRYLSYTTQENLKTEMPEANLPKYIANGKIDMSVLLKDFQEYWRENSEIWINRYKKNIYQYDEAAPHLVLHAFLQRVVNGGGQIIREMALGTKRADLCVVYNGEKYPIELKILRNSKSIPDGLEQLSAYIDRVGSNEGWLVVFDRSKEISWEEKLYMRSEMHKGKRITITGA